MGCLPRCCWLFGAGLSGLFSAPEAPGLTWFPCGAGASVVLTRPPGGWAGAVPGSHSLAALGAFALIEEPVSGFVACLSAERGVWELEDGEPE